jgi:tRNA A-37 threonylcarbamoyl transferase component Bud32
LAKLEQISGSTAVQYKSPEAEWLRLRIAVATAAVIVLFPLPLIYLVFISNTVNLVMSCLLVASVLSVIAFISVYSRFRSNSSAPILLNQSGIELPGTGSQRRAIPWSAVEKISVGKISSRSQDEALLLSVENAQPVHLPLRCFSTDDLDKMVSACRLWSNRWAQDSSLIDLYEQVTSSRVEDPDSSFTGIWMQEANRRMGATAFTPLSPGATLQDGRLKIIQPLTTGGWSAIYLCQWKNNKPVILKEAVTPPGVSEAIREKAAEAFVREAVLLAGLDHRQIAKVLDYFVENDRQYMILERITGANMRAYVKDRGAVSEGQTLKWTHQLVDIISYLHSRTPPIVHRDITPENLVLDLRGSLVLIDFGSANEFVGTVTGTLVGKPSYISPEQFAGRANLQSDLYSLGAVMYFMLTGNDPEPMTAASPRKLNPEVTEQTDKLVSSLMEPRLKDRIPDIDRVKLMFPENAYQGN